MTFAVPDKVRAADIATALAEHGIEIAWQSQYLIERNWMQVALMGEIDAGALRTLPGALAECVGRIQLLLDASRTLRHTAAAPVSLIQ